MPTLLDLPAFVVCSLCNANDSVDKLDNLFNPVPDAADSLFGGLEKFRFVAPCERVMPVPLDEDDRDVSDVPVLMLEAGMPIVDAGGRDVVRTLPGVFPGVVGGSVFAVELSVGRATEERDVARLRPGVVGGACSV